MGLQTKPSIRHLRNWRSFQEAREVISRLGLKHTMEWEAYCRSGNKPSDIPSCPGNVYRNSGWRGMKYWLGTGLTRRSNGNWRSFEAAREFARGLGLESCLEWRAYCQSGNKPNDIPSSPNATYRDIGWCSFFDWLGLDGWRSFEEARKFARILGLRSGKDWKAYCKSGRKPDDIPTSPDKVYKDEGWIGWGDWLGTGNVSPKDRVWMPFEEARELARGLGLRSEKEWRVYCKSGKKPNNIPTCPDEAYMSKGWKSWGDWLGTGNVSSQHRVWRPFEEARELVRGLGLKKEKDWKAYCSSGKKPDDIPTYPGEIYKDKGWSGIRNWLGVDAFLPFKEARTFARSLGLKSQKEWHAYCRSGKRPDNIPPAPAYTYRDSGWNGLADWVQIPEVPHESPAGKSLDTGPAQHVS